MQEQMQQSKDFDIKVHLKKLHKAIENSDFEQVGQDNYELVTSTRRDANQILDYIRDFDIMKPK